MSDLYPREVMPESPSIAFRKAPTIKDKLVRSHLSSEIKYLVKFKRRKLQVWQL